MKVSTAEAPGRVNLMGDHTDYNQGFVLPTPIPLYTTAEVRPRSDRVVKAVTSMPKTETDQYVLNSESLTGSWTDYIKGLTWVLRSAGMDLGGFDLTIHSSVPIGSGLSSSAALEVSVLRALRDSFALPLDDLAVALLSHRAENEFVGARVGIMDQMVTSMGRQGETLFLDTNDLSFRHIRLPPEQLALVVIHSGIAHDHRSGEYNQRRSECEKSCLLLGISSLRLVERNDLPLIGDRLPGKLLKRVRHVVNENARVLEAVAALEYGDMHQLGHLFRESHESLRDDYEVSLPEIDLLVSLALEDSAVFGARLTGGGFGGSVVVLAKSGTGTEVAQRLVHRYEQRSGRQGLALVA